MISVNSPLNNKRNTNDSQLVWGFTLIEFVIVLGVLVLIIALGLPVGFESYRNYLLNYEARNLVSVLRRAETLSITQAHSTSYGVALITDKFVIFQGPSYALRNHSFDESYDKSSAINVTTTPPISEMSFAPISGLPNATATFVLSNEVNALSVELNAQGVVSW